MSPWILLGMGGFGDKLRRKKIRNTYVRICAKHFLFGAATIQRPVAVVQTKGKSALATIVLFGAGPVVIVRLRTACFQPSAMVPNALRDVSQPLVSQTVHFDKTVFKSDQFCANMLSINFNSFQTISNHLKQRILKYTKNETVWLSRARVDYYLLFAF